MMMCGSRLTRATLCLLIVVGILLPRAASAQNEEWTGNGFLNLNGGFQSGDRSFADALDAPLYDELAVYTNDYASSGGGLIDITGGVRVWRGLAAALGVTIVNSTSAVAVSGSVPHPLFFDTPRPTALQRADLTHRQVGFHFQAVYVIPVTEAIDIAVFGGPSVFRVEQDFVTGVTIGPEIDPFDTLALAAVATQASQENRRRLQRRHGRHLHVHRGPGRGRLLPLCVRFGGLHHVGGCPEHRCRWRAGGRRRAPAVLTPTRTFNYGQVVSTTLERSLIGPSGPTRAGVLTMRPTVSPDLGTQLSSGDFLM